MDIKKEEILVKRFPKILKGYNDPPDQSCLYWGFEHENGWFDLVYDMLLEMEAEGARLGIEPEILQIKNKFGYLRVYTSGPAEIYAIAQKYGKKSATICERCGKPGVLRTKGWHMVLCDLDNEEWNYTKTINWKK